MASTPAVVVPTPSPAVAPSPPVVPPAAQPVAVVPATTTLGGILAPSTVSTSLPTWAIVLIVLGGILALVAIAGPLMHSRGKKMRQARARQNAIDNNLNQLPGLPTSGPRRPMPF